MRSLRQSVVVASVLIGGCASSPPVSPVQSPVATPTARRASCRPDPFEARQIAELRGRLAGAPVSMVIDRAAGPAGDRIIRNGAGVVLRVIAGFRQQPAAPAAESIALSITSVGGAGADPVEIRGDSVVQLRPGGQGAAAPVALSERNAGARLPPGGDFVIYKTGAADRGAPSSCDTILRDGDEVYLRSVTPDGWVGIRNGQLVLAAPAASRAGPGGGTG